MSVFNLKPFLLRELRRISYRYPPRKEALRIARQERGKYVCATCSNIFGPKEIQVDHVEPVISLDGFTDWDSYINRLFCQVSGYQVLCKKCHLDKTLIENELRRENVKRKKRVKND